MFGASPVDGLAQPPPHSGWEAGGGYEPIRSPVPAGGGHLVLYRWHSRPLTDPWEATACLQMPARTWVLQNPVPSLFTTAPSLHLPALRRAPLPSKGGSGPGASRAGCGQASTPQCHPSSALWQVRAWAALPAVFRVRLPKELPRGRPVDG